MTSRAAAEQFEASIDAPAYAEFAPAADLRSAVACTWVACTGVGPASLSPIIPDACSDIIVAGSAAPHIAGPATRTHAAPVAPGTVIVGIRFRPGATRAVFGCSASELRDEHVELRAVGGLPARRLERELAGAPCVDVMRSALEGWVRARLDESFHRERVNLLAARELVVDRRMTVHELARSLGWSPRRLHREFTDTCGYGPKMLQRILRLQRAVRMGRDCRPERSEGPALPLSRLALDAGYADQAHMTRDFRDLTGFTPRALLANSRADVGQWLDVE